MPLFSEADEAAIAEAIANAENATSGEIVAVVTRDSGSYLYAPILWAALAALLIPWPFIYLTWLPVQWIYLGQLLGFVLLAASLSPQRIRLALVPRSRKHERAHRRAVEQFLVQNLATTKGRTGVLIFVSAAERYAEVIADLEIYEKVAKERWQAIAVPVASLNPLAPGRNSGVAGSTKGSAAWRFGKIRCNGPAASFA